MNRKKFIGTWQLKSFEVKCLDGRTIYPNGKNPIGYIHYSQDGYMSVEIMNQEREKFNQQVTPSEDFWKTIPLTKKSAAYETYLSYCGSFEVKDDEFVIHYLTACSIPDWVGTTQKRAYKFEDNILILSTTTGNVATLIWERI